MSSATDSIDPKLDRARTESVSPKEALAETTSKRTHANRPAKQIYLETHAVSPHFALLSSYRNQDQEHAMKNLIRAKAHIKKNKLLRHLRINFHQKRQIYSCQLSTRFEQGTCSRRLFKVRVRVTSIQEHPDNSRQVSSTMKVVVVAGKISHKR